MYKSLTSRFLADGFWDGVCYIDVDPMGDGSGEPQGGSSPSSEELMAQLAALQAELQNKNKALENSRNIERQYKKVEAILGDTNPEKLQELREADLRFKQQQEQMDKLVIEAKNSVKSEYQQQLEELRKQNTDLSTKQQQVALTFELFKEFNAADGDGTKFDGFVTLSQGLFHRTESGELQVKDARGRLVTTKDDDGNVRPAAPREFMKLLIAGKLDKDYDIPNSDFLKLSFSPYNKAMGAGLPNGNAAPLPKDLASLSQSQLGSLIFGG
jgi:hypothetical protein